MTGDELDAIRERAAAATGGPWRWAGNADSQHLRLQGRATTRDGRSTGATVVDFERWGMREAQPRFRVNGFEMVKGRDLLVFEVAVARGLPEDTPRKHPGVYRGDVVDVRHPDARFIAHARADVDALLAEVDRLRAVLDVTRAASLRAGAVGALEAALHEVDDNEDAQLLARRADQWRAETLDSIRKRFPADRAAG